MNVEIIMAFVSCLQYAYDCKGLLNMYVGTTFRSHVQSKIITKPHLKAYLYIIWYVYTVY